MKGPILVFFPPLRRGGVVEVYGAGRLMVRGGGGWYVWHYRCPHLERATRPSIKYTQKDHQVIINWPFPASIYILEQHLVERPFVI